MPNLDPFLHSPAIYLILTALVWLVAYVISIERRLSGIKADLNWIKAKLLPPKTADS